MHQHLLAFSKFLGAPGHGKEFQTLPIIHSNGRAATLWERQIQRQNYLQNCIALKLPMIHDSLIITIQFRIQNS
jgi:hypothetical protein